MLYLLIKFYSIKQFMFNVSFHMWRIVSVVYLFQLGLPLIISMINWWKHFSELNVTLSYCFFWPTKTLHLTSQMTTKLNKALDSDWADNTDLTELLTSSLPPVLVLCQVILQYLLWKWFLLLMLNDFRFDLQFRSWLPPTLAVHRISSWQPFIYRSETGQFSQ